MHGAPRERHEAMGAGSWASTFIDFIEKASEEYPEVAGEIGCAPVPKVPIDSAWQVGVSKYSKNPKEVWLYCQFLVQRETMIKQWKVPSSFPVARSVIEGLAPRHPGIFKEVFLKSLLRAGFRNFVPKNSLLEDSIAKWITEYVASRIDAESATREMAKEWKQILKYDLI